MFLNLGKIVILDLWNIKWLTQNNQLWDAVKLEHDQNRLKNYAIKNHPKILRKRQRSDRLVTSKLCSLSHSLLSQRLRYRIGSNWNKCALFASDLMSPKRVLMYNAKVRKYLKY